MSLPRCLVTGGAGFIGSHLVDRLAANGHEVTVIDNFALGRHENLTQALATGRVTVHELDVADYETIEPHFAGIDWVFHLAGMASIVPSIENPRIYHRANVEGTINVLEAARRAGVHRFVYAASSSCYGIPDVYPTPENAEIRPMYPYALTKHLGEMYAMHWHQVYGLDVISLRLFNVFGPRHLTKGAYGAAFGVFLAQKLADQPLTVVGDGEQTRDFTFVSDVVDAFVAAADSDVSGEIFNVGSDHTYSVNHLVELIGGPTVNIPKRPGEPDCTYADITKIKSALNWRPEMSFEAGVEIMLENLESWRGAPVWTVETIEDATSKWFEYLGNEK